MHQRFITYVGDALNAVLPAHYIADIGERLYIIQPERSIYPDVAILEHPSARPPRGQAGMAAMVSDPPWVVTYHPVEMREVFIEIPPVARERMSRGPRRCCMTVGSAREAIVPLE